MTAKLPYFSMSAPGFPAPRGGVAWRGLSYPTSSPVLTPPLPSPPPPLSSTHTSPHTSDAFFLSPPPPLFPLALVLNQNQ